MRAFLWQISMFLLLFSSECCAFSVGRVGARPSSARAIGRWGQVRARMLTSKLARVLKLPRFQQLREKRQFLEAALRHQKALTARGFLPKKWGQIDQTGERRGLLAQEPGQIGYGPGQESPEAFQARVGLGRYETVQEQLAVLEPRWQVRRGQVYVPPAEVPLEVWPVRRGRPGVRPELKVMTGGRRVPLLRRPSFARQEGDDIMLLPSTSEFIPPSEEVFTTTFERQFPGAAERVERYIPVVRKPFDWRKLKEQEQSRIRAGARGVITVTE